MAAGDFAKYSSTSVGQPSTTPANLDFATEDVDAGGIVTRTAAGVYRPDDAGYYAIVPTGRHVQTANDRLNIVWEISKNGTTLAGGVDSGYARNNNNDLVYISPRAIAYFNGTSDTFSVAHYRDGDAPGGGDTYDFIRFKLVQLSAGAAADLAYGHYGTPTGGAHGGTTPNVVAGLDVITENDTAAIELQAGGSDITLKNNGRVTIGVYGWANSDGGGSRTQRVADVTLDGTRVAHSGGYGYSRQSVNQYGYASGFFLVQTDAADEDLNFRIWRNTAVSWGVMVDGSWTLSTAADDAGVMLLELPASVAVGIWEDLTGGQAIDSSATTDLNIFRTAVGTPDSVFTRDNNTDVTVGSAISVFGYAGVLSARDPASGTRNTVAAQWEIEGINVGDSEDGVYIRGDQGNQDTPNGVLDSTFVETVTTGDTLQLEKFDPGTDDGANDDTVFGGGFLIDLDSLGSVPPIERTVDDDLELTDSLTSVQDAARPVTDPLELTDTAAPVADYSRPATDPLGLTDTHTRVLDAARALLDALGFTDSLTTELTKAISLTDNLGLTDLIAAVLESNRPLTDAAGLTDSLTSILSAARTPTDNLGLTDSLELTLTKTVTDALGLTDPVIDVDTNLELITDNLGLTDSLAVVLSSSRTVTDAFGLTDFPVIDADLNLELITDNLGLTDSVVAQLSIPKTVTDALGLTDALAAVVTYNVTITDALGLTDFPVIDADLNLELITDNLGLTDDVTVELETAVALADALGLTDSLAFGLDASRPTSDALGLTDSLATEATVNVEITDNLGLTDDVTASEDDAEELTDNLGLTDSVSAMLETAANISDNLGLTDSVLQAVEAARSSTDALGLTDTADQALDAARGILEALGLTDSIEVLLVFEATVTDTFGLTDSLTVELTKNVTIDDNLGLTDQPLTVGDYAQTVDDNLDLTDTVVAVKFTGIEITVTDALGLTDVATTADGWWTPDPVGSTPDPVGSSPAPVGSTPAPIASTPAPVSYTPRIRTKP